MKRLAFLVALICVSWVYADSFRTLDWFTFEPFLSSYNDLVQSVIMYGTLCFYSVLYAFIALCLLKEVFKREGPLLFLETHRIQEDGKKDVPYDIDG